MVAKEGVRGRTVPTRRVHREPNDRLVEESKSVPERAWQAKNLTLQMAEVAVPRELFAWIVERTQ